MERLSWDELTSEEKLLARDLMLDIIEGVCPDCMHSLDDHKDFAPKDVIICQVEGCGCGHPGGNIEPRRSSR